MVSPYYNSAGKEVYDGDVVYAADLNDINDAVDTAFQLAETNIGTAGTSAEEAAISAAAALVSEEAAAAIANSTAYDPLLPYSAADVVYGSNMQTYRALVTVSIGDDPVTSTTGKWAQLTGAAGNDITIGEASHSFSVGSTYPVYLSEVVSTPIVSVTKEVPKIEVTDAAWDTAVSDAIFSAYDTSYEGATVTPSATTGIITISLSTGTFETTDVGKMIVGNGGKAYLLDIGGGAKVVKDFTDTSAITDWTMSHADVDNRGVKIAGYGYGETDFTNVTSGTVIDTLAKMDWNITTGQGLYWAKDKSFYLIMDTANYVYKVSTISAYTSEGACSNKLYVGLDGLVLPKRVWMSDDGTKLYLQSNTKIGEYTLSVPYQLWSSTLIQVIDTPSPALATMIGIDFKSDGTIMVIADASKIYSFSLSTPFDISTLTYVSTLTIPCTDLSLSEDGLYLFYTNASALVCLLLTVPWDVGGGTTSNGTIGGVDGVNTGVSISTGGTSIMTSGTGSNTIRYWSLPTPYDPSSAVSYLTNQLSNRTGTTRFARLSPDGMRVYILTNEENFVQLNLTIPWDMSTAYLRDGFRYQQLLWTLHSFGISPDGRYLLFSSNYTTQTGIRAFRLSVPWEINSFVKDYYTQIDLISIPETMDLSLDGTLLKIKTSASGLHKSFKLSVPFDLSTAIQIYDYRTFPHTTYSWSQFSFDHKILYLYTAAMAYRYETQTPEDLHSYELVASGSITTNLSFYINDAATVSITFASGGSYKSNITGTTSKHVVTTGEQALAISDGNTIDTSLWTDIHKLTPFISEESQSVFLALSLDERTTWSVFKEGQSPRGIARNNNGTWQYNKSSVYSSDAWTDAPTNNEYVALREAIQFSPVNQMNKGQLEAAGAITPTNTLDIAVSLETTDSEITPVFYKLYIEYSGNSSQEGAITGVDYTWEAVSPTTVNITSVYANNFKIRII